MSANNTLVAQRLLSILNGTLNTMEKHVVSVEEYSSAKVDQSRESKMALGLSLGIGGWLIIIVIFCAVFHKFCNIQKIKDKQIKIIMPNGRNKAQALDEIPNDHPELGPSIHNKKLSRMFSKQYVFF